MSRASSNCRVLPVVFFLGLAAVSLTAQDEPATLQAGAVAPDFMSKDLAGKDVRLADFAGRTVVLDFWATWCGPCLASLPHVQEIAKHEKDHGVVVLAVCTSDTRAKFDAWMQKNKDAYPDIIFTCDPFDRGSKEADQRASARLYHVSGLPTKFVVAKDGKIALTMVGSDAEDQRLEAGLARAGLTQDAVVVKNGEAQIAKQAQEDAAAAAEAKANPPPTFWPVFGSMKAGEAMPEFTLVGADGKNFQFSSLKGKPVILGFAWGEIIPKAQLQEMWESYSGYGVHVLECVVCTPRAEYDAWVTANAGKFGFATGMDPAGKFVSTTDPVDQTEREAFSQKTVIKKFFHGNMSPGMPAWVVADAEGRFVGSFGNRKWQDAVANLLLHSGVKLKPEHMPKVVAPDKAFVAPVEAPKVAEKAVALISVGTAAPDFTMQDVDGKSFKLSDLRGKVVVLDFWATWCGPCKAAMPHVQKLAEQYKDQGVVVIASCTSDARAAFVAWVKKGQQDFPHIQFGHDALEKSPENASRKLYGVSGIPAQFVIDREGKIVAFVSGYTDGEVLLDAALAKAGIPVDAAVLAKAVEDQKARDARATTSKPAAKTVPMAPMHD